MQPGLAARKEIPLTFYPVSYDVTDTKTEYSRTIFTKIDAELQ